ncbi:hypothetical protein ANCDUO_22724 [Ancylostoma duodenale]|uniref:Uncharacterized protein n=1 Tax=Ancylostoma duodenale TaxID=51022 RepID=A0A0C2FKD4_9BILA|nr:hypothetical protein ANCDUO_22724 [Ancylostoma duodenale]
MFLNGAGMFLPHSIKIWTVYWLGPLGALSLIPMCALYMGCEYMAKKRRVKRVGEMLDGQNITVDEEVLHHLLTKKVSEV